VGRAQQQVSSCHRPRPDEPAFEVARKQNPEHPFNSPAYKGASVLEAGAAIESTARNLPYVAGWRFKS
jgi:hypothetical protein